MITVRFAPSPTGHLHIGGVRTALFNYLYAKNQQGQFVLRIEDTDVSRSSHKMSEEIINGLKWLGFHWDQGPYYQSQRFERYKKTALTLLEEKKAYHCFCSPEELNQRRNSANPNEKVYKYDRKCLQLTPEQIEEKINQNIPHVIRFHIPEGKTYFKDSLHKQMETDNTELEDFVILKSDGSPTYHLSVVVDDSDMAITHVIRGDDHISNTFKQVLLFNAMGLKPPKYAHLPLIMGADKKKLSKRHGETSVLEFKEKGYLPEALINYLSQLSWIPADTKKIFSLQELAKQFSLSKLAKNSPVFDYDKLLFLNGRAVQQKQPQELYQLLKDNYSFMETIEDSHSREKIIELIQLVKPRMKTLRDFEEKFNIYLQGGAKEALNYNNNDFQTLINTCQPTAGTSMKENLELLCNALEELESNSFDSGAVEQTLRQCAETNGLNAADLIHPARFALTSETVSPSIFAVFAFFGKQQSIRRISQFISYLEQMHE